ncbi:hypothetical protein Tco_1483097 [Tanacetum coccineum]
MLKDQFLMTEELAYHKEILDEPTTPLLDIDLDSPVNIISRAYYNKIQAKGLQRRRNPFHPEKICNFVVIEDRLSEVVFGVPFLMKSKLEYNLTNGRIRLEAILCEGEEDVKKGLDHIFSKRKGYYRACLNLGKEYKKDEETIRRLTEHHVSIIKVHQCLRHSGGGLILSQAYGNLYAMTALGANGDVLEAFRGISRQMDKVRMEPGHEDTDFLKTPKTS